MPKEAYIPLVDSVEELAKSRQVQGAVRGLVHRGRGIANQVNWARIDLDALVRTVSIRSGATGFAAGAVITGVVAVGGVVYLVRSGRLISRGEAAGRKADHASATEPEPEAAPETDAGSPEPAGEQVPEGEPLLLVSLRERVEALRLRSDRL